MYCKRIMLPGGVLLFSLHLTILRPSPLWVSAFENPCMLQAVFKTFLPLLFAWKWQNLKEVWCTKKSHRHMLVHYHLNSQFKQEK